jgi:hypothetical protein
LLPSARTFRCAMQEEEREETEGNMVELMFEDGNGAFTESVNADLWRIVKALCAPILDPRLAFPTKLTTAYVLKASRSVSLKIYTHGCPYGPMRHRRARRMIYNK